MMMSAPELTPTVSSLVLALLALAGTTDGAITCEAVTTRYESTVTCFFGTDIFDTKHSFNLQFYYPNLQADPETPLMCNWVTSEDMDCKESQGVVYDRVLADQITVKGPADPRRVGGKYVCQVLPSLDVPVKPCNLTFRDVTTTTTTTTTQSNALNDLTDKVTTTLVLCGLALTVALIILIAVLFIVCTRVKLAEKIRKWRMWTKKKPDVEKPEETADAGEKVDIRKMVNLFEQAPLLPAASNAEKMNEVEVKSGEEKAPMLVGKKANEMEAHIAEKEAHLLHMLETPRPSRGEAVPPVDPRTVESRPAGKEGDRAPRPSRGEAVPPVDPRTVASRPAGKEGDRTPGPLTTNKDDQSEVDMAEEDNPQPKKKKKWSWSWPWSSSSSSPKAQPGDRNSIETGDPPGVTTGNKGKSSEKEKKKSRKSKEVKGEGEKDLPGTEAAQQPAPTVNRREEPSRRQSDK